MLEICEVMLYLVYSYLVYMILFDDGFLPRKRGRQIHPNPDSQKRPLDEDSYQRQEMRSVE